MGQSIKADAQSISDIFSIRENGQNVNPDTQYQTREEAISTRYAASQMEQADGRQFVDDVQFMARDGRLTEQTTEAERYELLKDAVLTVTKAKTDKVPAGSLVGMRKTESVKAIKNIARLLGIEELNLHNSSLDMDFGFSLKNVGKSASHQSEYGGNSDDFVKALSCIEELAYNAIPIEMHTDKKVNTAKANPDLKMVYVFVSAFSEEGAVVPVQMEVKEFYTSPKGLYLNVALKKIESGVWDKASQSVEQMRPNYLVPNSSIRIADIFRNVNPKTDARFLKYVPDGFLNDIQKAAKENALAAQNREYESYQYQTREEAISTRYAASKMEQADGRQFVDDVQFQARNGVEFMEHKYYAGLIDRFEEQNQKGYIKVGKILEGSILNKIGIPESELYFDNSKINKALNEDHPDHISKAILKKIPDILRNPIVIAEDKRPGNINIYGDVWIGKSPVLVALMVTHDRTGESVISKIRTVHAKRNAADQFSDNKVLYLNANKKRTRHWFQALGTHLPQRGTKFGFIRSIAFEDENVNSDIQKQTRDQTDTPEFQRWFKGSKIVNEDGSPKVMYHGTPYGGFTVFKDWQYFTDDRDYADVYHSPSASSIRGRYNDATNPMTYAVYLNVKKPFDTRDPKIRRIWQEEFYDNYSRTPLSDKGLPDWTDGIDLVEFIEDNEYDYDAIILDEGAVGGYGDDVKSRGISVVVRSSNQVKSATDNIGTFDPEDPDIQRQTREEAISTRFVLANMLEADATNSEEVAWLRGYKGQLNELEKVLDAIEGNRQTVRELMFEEKTLSNGKKKLVMRKRTPDETERLKKAQNRIKILQEQVARMDEGLLNLENADVIRNLVATSVTMITNTPVLSHRGVLRYV